MSICSAPPPPLATEMTNPIPPAISFVARSGTGKTTLLEKLIVELKARGYRVGVFKHDAHKFEIDHPGKDSHRLTHAGADTMLISSANKLAMVKQQTPAPLEQLLADYCHDVDLVLVEGYKSSGLPKIELFRAGFSEQLLCRGATHDPALLAVATDTELQLDVPQLDLNDPARIADFFEAQLNLHPQAKG